MLISCALIAQLICSFVFANAEDEFSHDVLSMSIYQILDNVFLENLKRWFNPLVKNALSHHYHLGESTFILGESGVVFICLIYFFTFLKHFL